jgi:hypothetical protein
MTVAETRGQGLINIMEILGSEKLKEKEPNILNNC